MKAEIRKYKSKIVPVALTGVAILAAAIAPAYSQDSADGQTLPLKPAMADPGVDINKMPTSAKPRPTANQKTPQQTTSGNTAKAAMDRDFGEHAKSIVGPKNTTKPTVPTGASNIKGRRRPQHWRRKRGHSRSGHDQQNPRQNRFDRGQKASPLVTDQRQRVSQPISARRHLEPRHRPCARPCR